MNSTRAKLSPVVKGMVNTAAAAADTLAEIAASGTAPSAPAGPHFVDSDTIKKIKITVKEPHLLLG